MASSMATVPGAAVVALAVLLSSARAVQGEGQRAARASRMLKLTSPWPNSNVSAGTEMRISWVVDGSTKKTQYHVVLISSATKKVRAGLALPVLC